MLDVAAQAYDIPVGAARRASRAGDRVGDARPGRQAVQPGAAYRSGHVDDEQALRRSGKVRAGGTPAHERRRRRRLRGVYEPAEEQDDGECADGEREGAATCQREGHVSSVPWKSSQVCDDFVTRVRLLQTTRLTSLFGTTKAFGSLPSFSSMSQRLGMSVK